MNKSIMTIMFKFVKQINKIEVLWSDFDNTLYPFCNILDTA